MNVPCLKCPLDLWIYQEILVDIEPDLILETGTHMGGSTLFMAHVLDAIGKGQIITIDVRDDLPRPTHPRIRYVTGSSADPELVDELFACRSDETRLIVLDSDHSKRHVLAELNLLAKHASVGSYVIVEDTNVNGHPALEGFGPGPWEAVAEFLENNDEFVADEAREKFLLTFNPRGYLKRIEKPRAVRTRGRRATPRSRRGRAAPSSRA
jgi:cephalosporin hydroxylase